MRYIKPSRISGSISAPASKSMMQRAVIAAALAPGRSTITNPSFCDDAKAAISVAKALGAIIEAGAHEVRIKGAGEPVSKILDCGESGTCMRMIAAIAALHADDFTITGHGSLLKRPVGMVEAPLRALGAGCETNGNLPPIKIKGPIHGGNVVVDGSESSQFMSGLLMALPLCKQDSEVKVLNLKSKSYVSMTKALLRDFNISIECDEQLQHFHVKGNQKYAPTNYQVDGDWSGAAFMLVAGAIAGNGDVEIKKLKSGLQPDESIKTALRSAGAEVSAGKDSIRVTHPPTLRSFDFDATGCPDLFPPLVVLACNCEGRSVIHGADRLRHKESDRAAVLAFELGKLGAHIKVNGDRMEIEGAKLRGGRIHPRNDHRIAMACAVAALASENGVEIEDEECVSKSYPRFFEDLDSLAGEAGEKP